PYTTLFRSRGKIVLLDFWTFCCINCLHVIDELRPLEERYADVLVVIGVHSPKFAHERDPAALAAAVERYGVHHPVLDDPDLVTWRQYAARAWPTLAVVDPEGYLVASMAGEGHAPGLARLFDELITVHEQKGTLRRGRFQVQPPTEADSSLRFPGKAVALPGGGFRVSDSARHRLVELAADGQTVVRRIVSGQRGAADGPADRAEFDDPQAPCRPPQPVAAAVGADRAAASGERPTARPTGRSSTSRRGCAGCRSRSRRRSGTTWWWPTPSTTGCGACAWPTGRSARSPAPGAPGGERWTSTPTRRTRST